ncbi:MAG: alpha-ribazole phosphatase [Prolixibacteraceae bacterium]|jgi:alpha-ribazole phosphatase
MIITAIRHTSVDVPSGICYGTTDVPLSKTFGDEATLILRQLKNQHFDRIFSSPVSRCTTLASRIFPEREVISDQRLVELNFGDWEMQQWETIFNSPEGKAWFANYTLASCPNGESFADLISRVNIFLDQMETTEDHQIIMVTHAGVIRTLMCLLQHKTPEEAFHTPLKFGEILNFNYADPQPATI